MREEDKHLRKATEILPKGSSIVVFPQFVFGIELNPITSGTRYSLGLMAFRISI